MTDTSLPPPARPHDRISDLMRELLTSTAQQEDEISVGDILQLFGVRGFAFLILVLSLLNIVIFFLPFISLLFGLPMIMLAAQIVLGLPAPVFPLAVLHRTIPRTALMQGLERSIFWMEKVERYIRPRFLFLSEPLFVRVHGLLAMMLAVMVALPIPLFNIPPSIGLALLAIGILQRDGIFIILAYAIAVWCLVLFESLGHAVLH